MLRNITRTIGSAMATLCLVSTLAMAQAQQLPPQTQQGHRQDPNPMMLTCSKDNGKGNCVAAKGPDGKEFVVNGEGLKSGASMSCVDRGTVVDCKPAS
jgi:hypothetical protein